MSKINNLNKLSENEEYTNEMYYEDKVEWIRRYTKVMNSD